MATQALALVPPAPQSNVDNYRMSTDAATLCKEIVVATAKNIQGRDHVCVEGWQAIAIAHGCTGSARDVERVEGGYRAIGEVRRMSDGAVIATGEGFVGEDEPVWFGGTMKKWKWGQKKGEKIWYDEVMPKRADYAIRAMAQTRSISRACRSAFAHVVVMMNAGLQTTPAEEIPYDGFTDVTDDAPRETARDRASREAGANGGTHPNNMPGADDDFDAAATALRIGGLLKTAGTKAEIGQIWNKDSREDRARLKVADPAIYKALTDQLDFETQRVSPPKSPQYGDALDEDVRY